MRLIVVRHGETEENAKGIVQGHRHGKLSLKGKDQIKRLAKQLKNEKIDVIFSSDLRRAAATTKEIARFHAVPVHHVRELRERHMGIYQGKPYYVMNAAQSASGLHKAAYRPKGGETYSEVKRRLKRFLEGVYVKYPEKTVLLSTHGIAIRCILSSYLGIPLKASVGISTANAGFIILEVKRSRARVLRDKLTGDSLGNAPPSPPSFRPKA